jgi:NADH dehydrogenase/NADH:ubiquinone oxidoreductase subunit G
MALNLTINDEKVTAEAGESLLDVARKNGFQIPSLCHHPMLQPYGACRICLVEVIKGGRTKLTTACNYEVQEGIEVKTETAEVKEHRKMLLELLLGQAPKSKRVQRLAEVEGLEEVGFEKVDSVSGRENCIVCGLCARVCSEVVGVCAVTLSGRGDKKALEVPFKDWIFEQCIGCGACTSVCPTGAIDMEKRKIELLRELPPEERACRYAKMGLIVGAVCTNNFECAKCEVDQRFLEEVYPNHPIFLARGM